ncbi:MAG: hypothetical protein E7493_09650 [Ruminococcus albus]|nr:hypothetical protein [Ruminococcus albus]
MDKVIQKTIGDTVCRVHKTADFTMLSNGFIGSTNISCQAILLLAQAMSLPQNWNFTIKGLEKICAVGETAVRNMLKELETWGYLVRTKLMPSKETGGRIKYIYDFYEYSAKDTSVPQADVVMETYTAENATIYKVPKNSHFTVISNKLLRSKKLNPKQKGLLLKVLSLPNTWRFSVSGIVKICKEGKSAIKARLAELTELGYLVRTQLKSNESKNHCFEYIYEFFEIALSKEDAEKKSEKTRKNAKKSVKDLFPTRLPGGQEKSKKSAKNGDDTSKKQHGGFRSAENPNAETPQAEKQGQLNTNEKINKNKKFSYKDSINPSAPQKNFQQISNKRAVEKSADERMMDEYTKKFEIYKSIIKQNIDFYEFASWLDSYCDEDEDGWTEAEQIVEAMVRQILSTKPYEVIHGQKFPRASVESAMMKANICHLQNVVEQMKEVLNIRNYEAYLISSIYNEVVNYHVKKNAESRAISYDIRQTFGY